MKAILLAFIGTVSAVVASATPAIATPQRPVVIIPGILGSVLTRDDRIVWGDKLSLTRFSELGIPDGPRDPDDGLKPTGLIESIQIFGPWKIDQYGGLRRQFADMGYTADIDYFEFAYDWRQSNFTTAEKLRAWVDTNPRLRGKEFDIVAHSMGGIVAELFIRLHDPNRQVRRVVTLGTPLLGSANAVGTLEFGWGRVKNWMAGGIDAVRRTVLSLPSIYELLPQYSNCCILGKPDDVGRKPYSIVAAEGWRLIDWGVNPSFFPNDKLENVLRQAARLNSLISAPLPDHLQGQIYQIAGDLIETRGQFYVDPTTHKVVHWNNFMGDGTVLVRSAARDEVSRAYVSFTEHGVIFDDKAATTTLKRILSPDSGPIEYTSPIYSAVTRDGDLIRIRSVGMSLEPAVLLPGETARIEIRIVSELGQPIDQLGLKGHADIGGREVELTLPFISSEDGFDSRRATYASDINVGDSTGPLRITVTVPGLEPIQDFGMILPQRVAQ